MKDRAEALAFLAQRDGVVFTGEPKVLETSWSEQMVSWINSPGVMAVLVMLALLGVYVEFSTPGFGLAGIVAVICFAIIVGSKYLVGMANWVEILLLLVGILSGARGDLRAARVWESRESWGSSVHPGRAVRHADPQRAGRIALARDAGGLAVAVVGCDLAGPGIRRLPRAGVASVAIPAEDCGS